MKQEKLNISPYLQNISALWHNLLTCHGGHLMFYLEINMDSDSPLVFLSCKQEGIQQSLKNWSLPILSHAIIAVTISKIHFHFKVGLHTRPLIWVDVNRIMVVKISRCRLAFFTWILTVNVWDLFISLLQIGRLFFIDVLS